MKFSSFESLLGKKDNKMEEKGKEYVERMMARLEEAAKESGRAAKRGELKEIRGILEKKIRLMGNTEFMLLVFALADSLHKTIGKAKEDGREPGMTDIAGILLIMLIKMEKDGHIKIKE